MSVSGSVVGLSDSFPDVFGRRPQHPRDKAGEVLRVGKAEMKGDLLE